MNSPAPEAQSKAAWQPPTNSYRYRQVTWDQRTARNRSKLVETGPKTVKALPDPIRHKGNPLRQRNAAVRGNLLDKNNFLQRVASWPASVRLSKAS